MPHPGRHFVAVTDPGTPLEKLARERGFRAVFNAPAGRGRALQRPHAVRPGAGGAPGRRRPAAPRLAGAPWPRPAARTCRRRTIPGLRLGAALGELALAGRDKVTFVTSHSLESFPEWIEQLIAESTGKTIARGGRAPGDRAGRGRAPGPPEAYGDDRFFAALLLQGDDVAGIEQRLAALEAAGHPVARFRLSDRYDLGARDVPLGGGDRRGRGGPGGQPLRSAGRAARQGAGDAGDEGGRRGRRRPVRGHGRAREEPGAGRRPSPDGSPAPAGRLPGHPRLSGARPPDDRDCSRALQAALHEKTRLAVTLGYGPRFLHSTGQLHKGGPDRCRFLQLVDRRRRICRCRRPTTPSAP